MKKILFILIIFSLAIVTVNGVNVDQFSMLLNEDNSADFIIDFTLSERDYNILDYLPKPLYDQVTEKVGLTEDKKGRYEFSENNVTLWAEGPDSKVLLLPGFYFEDYDWRITQFEVKPDSLEEKILSSSIRTLINPDFEPDRIEIIWPDGQVFTAENVRYVPNLMMEI